MIDGGYFCESDNGSGSNGVLTQRLIPVLWQKAGAACVDRRRKRLSLKLSTILSLVVSISIHLKYSSLLLKLIWKSLI